MCKRIKDKTSCDRHLYVHAATLVYILFSDSCLLLPPALQELQLLRGKKEEAAEEVHMLNCPHPHRRGGHPEGEGDFSQEGCGEAWKPSCTTLTTWKSPLAANYRVCGMMPTTTGPSICQSEKISPDRGGGAGAGL